MKPIYAIKLRRKSGARDALHLLGSESTVTAGRDSLLQEHDADLNDCREHQDNGKADVQIGNSRAAPVEGLVELFTFFAHASSQSDTANVAGIASAC